MDALNDIPKTGQPKRLKSTDEARFKTRILEGTKLNDGIVRLNGKAIIKILKVEFKAKYSLSGVYKLLHRMGLSWIRPRPIHPLNDKQKMEDWKKALPLLSKKSKKNTERKRSKSGSKTKLVMANKEGWCQSGRKKIQGQK